MKMETIDRYVSAILDRGNGMCYSDVLGKHGLPPNGFADALMHIEDYIQIVDSQTAGSLKKIIEREGGKLGLFEMDYDYIKQQYSRLLDGKQKILDRGSLMHPKNVDRIIYCAFVTSNPDFESLKREEIIRAANNMPLEKWSYYLELRLGGILAKGLDDKKQSPLALFKRFDRVYQEKTGDESLFELSIEPHLHQWGDKFKAQRGYWKNKNNIEAAVYHSLTENIPGLGSKNRKEIVKGFNELPSGLELYRFFQDIQLRGVMNTLKGEHINSPIQVMRVFDSVYQKITNDKSLFDTNEEYYLSFNRRNALKRKRKQ